MSKIKVMAPIVALGVFVGGLFGLGPATSGVATAKADNFCIVSYCGNGGWRGGNWNGGWNGPQWGGGWGGGCRTVAVLSDYWQPGYSQYWGSRGPVWVQGPPFGLSEWNGTVYRLSC